MWPAHCQPSTVCHPPVTAFRLYTLQESPDVSMQPYVVCRHTMKWHNTWSRKTRLWGRLWKRGYPRPWTLMIVTHLQAEDEDSGAARRRDERAGARPTVAALQEKEP